MASQPSGASAGGSATLSCSITTSRHVVLGGEGFAEYRVDLRRDGLSWHVWARFRQFEALQRALPGCQCTLCNALSRRLKGQNDAGKHQTVLVYGEYKRKSE